MENQNTIQPLKISNKDLPGFSKGEEIFNAVTHIVGASIGIIFFVLGVVLAAVFNDAFAVIAMVIYGVSILLLYISSSIYHFLRRNRAKKVFRILDHCNIFVLIAGTYTPFCLIVLRNSGAWGWTIFGVLWFFATLGITANAINMHNPVVKKLSMLAYLVMGWCALIAIVPITNVMATSAIIWTTIGGIVYTVGAIFYGFGKKCKYMHSVWHLFVLIGSIIHFLVIIFYVVM
ncbi:MAG: hemolysin III family protein [Firmicutes bacterium]|nr:hemolysin III family protein [Bacillota bacterium]